MDSIQYLQMAKEKLNVQSDYALAPHLGVTRSAVSKVVTGRSTLGDETAIKVADILGLPRAAVLADVYAEREKNPEIAAVWKSVWEKFSLGFDALLLHGFSRTLLKGAVR